MSETFVYDGNPDAGVSEREWRLIQECEQRSAAVGAKMPFGDVLAYARHHNLPQEVIDASAGHIDEQGRVAVPGRDGVWRSSAFTDALQAREEPAAPRTRSASGATTATSGRRASSSATR